MLTIGCHLSTSKGFLAMGETALSIGANTFAFFTRNPRGGKAKAIDPGGRGGAARADGRAQLRPPGGACALHAQPLLGQAARPRVRARMHGRRPGAHGIHARQLLQLPSGKPREARRGSGHRADIGPAQPSVAPRADHHGAAGGHGRQGHRGRPHVRGAGAPSSTAWSFPTTWACAWTRATSTTAATTS